ncbi:hypothetical protein ACHAXS_007560 [Conticribra weissflogii]
MSQRYTFIVKKNYFNEFKIILKLKATHNIMSNENPSAAPPASAAAASAPESASAAATGKASAEATTKHPPTKKSKSSTSSPTARKLLQKLSALHPNASLESRQTIASWIIFNRKKAAGIAEGILLSVGNEANVADVDEGASRLLLLLRIVHQVLVANSSSAPAAGEGSDDAGEVNANANSEDAWEKSSHLRITLGEMVVVPLLDALASCLNRVGGSSDFCVQCGNEVKEMMDSWKKCNVFGGPTVVEEFRKGWVRALSAKKGEPGSYSQSPNEKERGSKDDNDDSDQTSVILVGINDDAAGEIHEQEVTDSDQLQGRKNITQIKRETQNEQKPEERKLDGRELEVTISDANSTENQDSVSGENAARDSLDTPVDVAIDNKQTGKFAKDYADKSSDDKPPTKELVIDFEGVEEAKVEPSQFLEAAKVIASLQITRDLGNDAAMSLSSVLSSIPPDVEQACKTIVQQQGQDENIVTNLADLLPDDSLNNLPDELLDLDMQYARQSLRTYRETIRQQRKARMQCLKLLLQSRFQFGSLDAARAFGCGDVEGGDVIEGGDAKNINMAVILEKLRKRKEALSDAMALEGLDVEEDTEEEKKWDMKEGEGLELLAWFAPENGGGSRTEDEPETKKTMIRFSSDTARFSESEVSYIDRFVVSAEVG